MVVHAPMSSCIRPTRLSRKLVMSALAMIGQDLDDLAGLDPSVGATFNHPLQFGFERTKAGDLLLDLRQSGLGDNIGITAGLIRPILKRKQGADLIDLEPELPGMPDEG